MSKNIAQPKLYDKASKYLESNGFEFADFGNYFPEGEEYGGISLSWLENDLCIRVIDSLCAHESPSRIVITEKESHLLEPILDVLMFAIKEVTHG